MTIKILFITGQSYSGSTVTCALFGMHPDMEPVSELAMLTKSKKGRLFARMCACERIAGDCPFWTDVRAKWLQDAPPNALQRYVRIQEKVETLNFAWPQLAGLPPRQAAEFEEYARYTRDLYRSITEIGGRDIIVDSSKKPGRAAALSRIDGLEVSAIHLVRSGINYLDSSIKRGKISLVGRDALYRAFRLGIRWSVTNLAAERMTALLGRRGMRLRYEDLIADPIHALDGVAAQLNLDLSSIQEHLHSGQAIVYRHMASGSHHRKNGPMPLLTKYLEPPNLDRRMVLAFRLGAWPALKHYGY